MKLLLILLFFCNTISAQVRTHNISDDGYAHVPLQFPFPLHGRVFTDSYMYSNGVVGFGSVNNHWCCSGYDLATNSGYQFNYSIMGLQTDLINYGSGRFLSEGTPQYQRYMWENISEFGRPNNLNTFGIEIRPSGSISMHYNQVNLDRPFTIGITGDTTRGEYTQYRFQNGLRTSEPFSYSYNGNLCVTNPLSSPSCPNYQEAYDAQQCALNALYRPSCAGYEQAYFQQQCSLNPLYNSQCTGYAQAYHTQQCSLNPLYATTCQGYEAAYFNQQCSLNPLYNSGCQGYAEAYFNYQCNINGLYDRTCPNYAEAYAQQQVTRPVPSVPQVQTSFTGEVTVSTPVIADPIVNTVVTRNAQTTNSVQRNTEPVSEKKVETKTSAKKETETKKSAPPTNTASKDDSPKVVDTFKYEQPLVLDPNYRKMVSKPIRDNGRGLYYLTITSDKLHRELIDEQYRKRD